VIDVAPATSRGERLNAGFAASRGDLVAYLTEESVWNVHHLPRLVERLEATGAVAAYADALRIGCTERDGRSEFGWKEDCVLSPSLRPGDLGSDEPIPVSSLMHRREVFAGFDATLDRLQGRDFLLRVAREGRVEHVVRVTSEYRAPVDDLGSEEERSRRLAEQHRVLRNYSHFEPLELMRRVVELYNENAYLKSRLSELQET
jgi:hypothetical protein